MNTIHREITNQIVADLYDQPIMSNLARPHYVERMIALGLSDEWRLVSANWSGYRAPGWRSACSARMAST